MAHRVHPGDAMHTSRFAVLGAITLVQASAYAQPDPASAPAQPAEPATTPVPETVTPSPTPSPTPPGPPGPPAEAKKPDEAKVTVGGYVEAYYQAHFQDPSNQITNLPGYDNRSRSFTLSNAAIDLKGEKGPVATHIIVQIGHTPSTYYLAEPASPGTGSVNSTSRSVATTSTRKSLKATE